MCQLFQLVKDCNWDVLSFIQFHIKGFFFTGQKGWKLFGDVDMSQTCSCSTHDRAVQQVLGYREHTVPPTTRLVNHSHNKHSWQHKSEAQPGSVDKRPAQTNHHRASCGPESLLYLSCQSSSWPAERGTGAGGMRPRRREESRLHDTMLADYRKGRTLTVVENHLYTGQLVQVEYNNPSQMHIGPHGSHH